MEMYFRFRNVSLIVKTRHQKFKEKKNVVKLFFCSFTNIILCHFQEEEVESQVFSVVTCCITD